LFAAVVALLPGLPVGGLRAGPPEAPGLKLEKTGPATVRLGEPLRYTIVVRNPGPVAAEQVRVEDRLSADTLFLSAEPKPELHDDRLSWSFASLEPNAERRITVVLQPQREGELESRATVTYSASCALQTRVVQPHLLLRMTGPDRVPVGDPAVFEIQVTNAGLEPVTNVTVRDRLPAGLRHPQGEYIEAVLGTLAPAETRKLTLRALAARPGRHVHEATAFCQEGLRATVQLAVTAGEPAARPAGPAPALQLEVTDRDDPIEVGAATVYRIRLRNRGSAPATGVRLNATAPAGLAVEKAAGPVPYRVEGTQVHFEPLAQVTAGAEAEFFVHVRGKRAGDWRFTAEVTAESGNQTVREEQSTRVYGD
jgi:uncharacterized repeat protein (TIGR01451 family)